MRQILLFSYSPIDPDELNLRNGGFPSDLTPLNSDPHCLVQTQQLQNEVVIIVGSLELAH